MGTYEDPSTWRLSTTGGIPYRLVNRSGSYTDRDASASETYLIRASDLDSFVNEVFPAPSVLSGAVVYKKYRRMPGTSLPPTEISWKGHIEGLPIDPYGADEDAPTGTYQDILEVEINYNTGDVDSKQGNEEETDPEDPRTYCKVSGRASGEFLHAMAPRGIWSEGAGDFVALIEESAVDGIEPDIEKNRQRAAPVPVMTIVPEIEWTVTWEMIPYDAFRFGTVWFLRAMLGKLNSLPMPLLHDAPPGTILFVGFDFEEEYTWRTGGIFDTKPVTLSLKFVEKCIVDGDGEIHGHNSFWRPEKGGWSVLILNEDTGKLAYDYFDLNAAFKPSSVILAEAQAAADFFRSVAPPPLTEADVPFFST